MAMHLPMMKEQVLLGKKLKKKVKKCRVYILLKNNPKNLSSKIRSISK
jgi:hypothetical protein